MGWTKCACHYSAMSGITKRVGSFERCISALSRGGEKTQTLENIEIKRCLTWQFSQHSPCAHMEPAVSLHVSGSQHSFVHSCERIGSQSSGPLLQGSLPLFWVLNEPPCTWLLREGGRDVNPGPALCFSEQHFH